jgi:hypothetical protein
MWLFYEKIINYIHMKLLSFANINILSVIENILKSQFNIIIFFKINKLNLRHMSIDPSPGIGSL